MPDLPPQANRPTEDDKKANPTEEKLKAKMRLPDGTEKDVEIIAKTKPNANGGYDTEIHVPQGHIGVRRIEL